MRLWPQTHQSRQVNSRLFIVLLHNHKLLSTSAPVFLCTNVADAFRAGSYVKSYCLVSTNLNFDAAAENCNRLGLKPYEPMPIEDPLFFFMNGNQQPYAETQQVFITKTDDIDPEFNLYCTGYFLFRGLYQKSAVDCEIPSFSFCEFKKAIGKL